MVNSKASSEFGGVPGRVGPLPHAPTSAEKLRLVRLTDTTDSSDTPEAALLREWEAERRTGEQPS